MDTMKKDNIVQFFPALQNHWFEGGLPTGGANEFTSTHWHKSTFIEDYFWKVFVCSHVSPFRVFIILAWQVVLVINTIC
jgi:hypothetical protein